MAEGFSHIDRYTGQAVYRDTVGSNSRDVHIPYRHVSAHSSYPIDSSKALNDPDFFNRRFQKPRASFPATQNSYDYDAPQHMPVPRPRSPRRSHYSSRHRPRSPRAYSPPPRPRSRGYGQQTMSSSREPYSAFTLNPGLHAHEDITDIERMGGEASAGEIEEDEDGNLTFSSKYRYGTSGFGVSATREDAVRKSGDTKLHATATMAKSHDRRSGHRGYHTHVRKSHINPDGTHAYSNMEKVDEVEDPRGGSSRTFTSHERWNPPRSHRRVYDR